MPIVDNSELSGLTPLPLQGINPWSWLASDAIQAYAAYKGGKDFVVGYLRQHPREEDSDFIYRTALAYSLRRTYWATQFLTRTINNRKYPVIRKFGEFHPELEYLITHRPISGKTWDARLKEASIDALLGGVSYLFINQNALGPQIANPMDIQKNSSLLDVGVLRAHQVSNIIFGLNGYITQCEITYIEGNDRLKTRYFDNQFEIWIQKNKKGTWILQETGSNPLGLAPLIPVHFNGVLNDAYTIFSPIHAVVPLDIDIMNILSDCRHAFSLFNFPMMAIPLPIGALTENTPLGNEPDGSIKKVPVGPMQGFYYNQQTGPPLIVEPRNLHIDSALKMIEFLQNEIEVLVGYGEGGNDHPLTSGVSKLFSFNDTNETYRGIHSYLEDIEYQTFYLLSQMLIKSNKEGFEQFRDNVQISHPSSFDPTGGQLWKKLNDVLLNKDILLQLTPEEIWANYERIYWRQVFREQLPDDEINEILDKAEKDFLSKANEAGTAISMPAQNLNPNTSGGSMPAPEKTAKTTAGLTTG